MKKHIDTLKQELSKHIIGHPTLINALLIGLLSEGHILIEGLPGLAKTTAVNALAKALGLDFKRVQFTADLLPSDILGAEVYHPKTESFVLNQGPVFTNLLLCDEINRASAKVHSALLEVMQERQVSIGDHSFAVPSPFIVIATQNPIDQEGTYALPEAQLDRFMIKTLVGYNTEAEEFEIATKIANQSFAPVEQVIDAQILQAMQKEVKEIHIEPTLSAYIIKLVFATREPKKYGLEALENSIAFGASPRASIDLIKASKASAYLRGHTEVSPIDIALCAKEVLRHRIVFSYDAEVEDVSSDNIIDAILQQIDID